MTPSYAIKKGVRYRYYVSCVLAQGRKDEAGSVSRVAASEIETIVMDALATLAGADVPATRRDHPMPTGFGEKAHREIDDETGAASRSRIRPGERRTNYRKNCSPQPIGRNPLGRAREFLRSVQRHHRSPGRPQRSDASAKL